MKFFKQFKDDDETSWDYLIAAYLLDKDLDTISPELPRIFHVGKKGTTANIKSQKRNEMLKFSTLNEVLRYKMLGIYFSIYQLSSEEKL